MIEDESIWGAVSDHIFQASAYASRDARIAQRAEGAFEPLCADGDRASAALEVAAVRRMTPELIDGCGIGYLLLGEGVRAEVHADSGCGTLDFRIVPGESRGAGRIVWILQGQGACWDGDRQVEDHLRSQVRRCISGAGRLDDEASRRLCSRFEMSRRELKGRYERAGAEGCALLLLDKLHAAAVADRGRLRCEEIYDGRIVEGVSEQQVREFVRKLH